MNRFVLICLFFTYYVAWSLLPIFEIENSNAIISLLFPISSDVAIFLPIFLLLLGFTLTGSLLGVLLLCSDKKKKT
ncbi:YIL102C-A [Saccharomyces arboricola H-6]|uniref:Dolichol phosphate-mannose biosynthesis regulatory protein n=1 Tax=Saccharomyces arboricola (strain H-6 / AS 2.3317 / CBS 10644) TaxID=1160507 RepID=J8PMH5_SACAR|nr:YIL102C-A [Saccharomyces arboricola H-6]